MAGRLLGVNGSSDAAYVAIVEDGSILDIPPFQFALATGLAPDRQLTALHDDVRQVLRSNSISKVVVVSAETNYAPGYVTLIGRLAIETIIELAAAEECIPFERLSRARLRSLFDLPKKGSVSDLLKGKIDPVGKNWLRKRDVAAAGALALAKAVVQ